MKIPIYEKLQSEKKSLQSKSVNQQKAGKIKSSNNLNDVIESLYKTICLNSKYHHREKMRFERTPLMKYIECKSFDHMKMTLKPWQKSSKINSLCQFMTI